MQWNILYQDDFFIIFNKPAGLAVQPGKNITQNLISSINKCKNFYLLHRLDRDTSGIIILAKKRPHKILLTSFSKSSKKYLAIVKGKFFKKKIELKNKIKIKNHFKQCFSKVKVVKTFSQFSLVEIILITGRFHQIRKQFSDINHPVIGDDKYGDFKLNQQGRYKKLLLHSWQFNWKEKKIISITAPLPNYFHDFFKKYNLNLNIEV